jgi:hypothetical protein
MARASSGSWQRAAALALGFAGAVTCTAWAHAQSVAPERDWLRWQGPLECQNTREVERQIESLLGRPPDLAQLPATRVELGWALERGWTLRISVELPQGQRRREVDVRSCADGFDVVALTLALILDPNLDLGADSSGTAEETAATATASAELPDAAAALASANQAPPLAPAEESDAAAAPDAAAAANPGAGRSAWPKLALSANGRADFGTLPTTLFGGGLELAFSASDWRVDAGGALLGKSGDTLATARYPVSYSNVFGLLRGCHEFGGERGGYFGLCLGAQLGSIGASEQGGEAYRARGLWAASSLGAEMGLDLSDSWGAFSRLELVFPLIHHQLELADGSVVHELPTVSLQLTLGASMKLTEWASR